MKKLFFLACAAIVGAATVRTAPVSAQPQDAGRIAYAEFKKLVDQDGVLIVDVRGRENYVNGHIPGAIVIPLGEIESRAAELTREKRPIVTYCA